MLLSIRISDYALISHLDIDFNTGFSVITGETGAGKSIILGALGLVMGNRADTKAIREGANKCVVEADFNIKGYNLDVFFAENDLDYSEICTIRREMNTNGKSRCFVNDTPVSLVTLKELGNRLIDIHSQHENLQLGNDTFQRSIIDGLADNVRQRDEYTKAYKEYVSTGQMLEQLISKAAKEKADEDYLNYLFRQLDDAKLKVDEDKELETEISTLAHAEEIKLQLSECDSFLHGERATLDLLRDAEQNLQKVSRYNADTNELLLRLKSSLIELKDIARSVDELQRNIDYDPQRLQQAEERLDLLNSLLAKHHAGSCAELINIREQLSLRLNQINSYDEQIIEAETNYKKCRDILENKAAELSKSRIAVKPAAEKHITNILLQLGIKHAQFEIMFGKLNDFMPYGTDRIDFLFAANKNQQLQDVTNVASGGEIARIMLAIKSLTAESGNTSLPTLIFDEIDTGVSGEIADSMGKIMQDMSRIRQIISITHLPQIASRGNSHYKVFKTDNDNSTETNIRKLAYDERIKEIATMLSGNQITDAAIANAKELLKSEN